MRVAGVQICMQVEVGYDRQDKDTQKFAVTFDSLFLLIYAVLL